MHQPRLPQQRRLAEKQLTDLPPDGRFLATRLDLSQSSLRLCINLPLCQRPGPLQLLDLLDQLELLNDLVLQPLLQVVQLIADGL